MQLDLKFSIFTLGLAVGTFWAALYGMNLKNFIEESDLGFGGVSAFCLATSAFVCMYGLRRLHAVQKLRMWTESKSGHGGGGDRLGRLGDIDSMGLGGGGKGAGGRERIRMWEEARERRQNHELEWKKGAGEHEVEEVEKKMAKAMGMPIAAARTREP